MLPSRFHGSARAVQALFVLGVACTLATGQEIDRNAPGFPDDGTWTVRWEGLPSGFGMRIAY
jgi:hypothetical protein